MQLLARRSATPKRVAAAILDLWLHLMQGSGGRVVEVIEELDLSLTQMKVLDALGMAEQQPSVKDVSERVVQWSGGGSAGGGTTGGTKRSGWFAPDDPQLARRRLTLATVASASSATIEIAELASQHGGPLAVRPKAEAHGARQLVPLAASYLTVFDVTDEAAPLHKSERGMIHLDGRPESLLARMWRQTLKVLVRESGI